MSRLIGVSVKKGKALHIEQKRQKNKQLKRLLIFIQIVFSFLNNNLIKLTSKKRQHVESLNVNTEKNTSNLI